jgi:hypothetical protein
MDLLEKAADGSTRDELTPAEITDVLAAKFDVAVTSSSGGSADVRHTQKTLAELHPMMVQLLGSSPFAHAKSGATILKSKGGEWQGLKLVVMASSKGAMDMLEKAADGSTRDELATAEIIDVLAARFDVTVTSSSGGSAVVCYTQKTLAELHPKLQTRSKIGTKYNVAKGTAIGMYSKPTKIKAKMNTDSAPLAGPALSPTAPREWHCPSGRISHEWRGRLAQCRNMCTQLGPSLIITERGTPLRRRGVASTHIHLPHEAIHPYIQHTWNSVKPPLFLKPTAASCSH